MKLFGPEGAISLPYGSVGRTVLEAGLALATGLLLARFAWAVMSPAGGASGAGTLLQTSANAAASPSNSNLALLTQSDPFRNQSISNEAATPTSLDLSIAGLRWSVADGTPGSAVLTLPDGSQKRVAPGDTIVPGAVMESVGVDRVFLRYNGQLQELLLNDPNKPLFASNGSGPAPRVSSPEAVARPATGPASPAATQPSAPQVNSTLLMTDVDLQPELRNGAVAGYRLSPRGQGYFEAAGLQSGDLVLRINGASIEGMGPDAIHSAVMSSEAIALDVVRDGAIVRLRLSPETGLAQ